MLGYVSSSRMWGVSVPVNARIKPKAQYFVFDILQVGAAFGSKLEHVSVSPASIGESVMSEASRTNFYDVPVLRVVDETPDSRSYTLDVPSELGELFKHRAGQFLTFEVPYEGMQLRRSYSLSSSVELGEAPTVVVKRVPDGRISNWFNDEVKEGMTLRVQPPAGRFVLNPNRNEAPLLLLGGGRGITPMTSSLKAALLSTDRKVRLVYANRDLESIIYRNELIRLQARFWERLEVVHHLDSERGFMTASDVEGLCKGWEDADAYICGPGPWMDVVESRLIEQNFNRANVHVERFVSPIDPDRQRPEVAEAMAAAAADAGTDSAEVELTVGGNTLVFDVDAGETILAAALRHGHEVEYQCEEGYCGCCMARLKDGEVMMPLHDALSDAEVEDGWVLTCQARCKSKRCVVDYDAGF